MHVECCFCSFHANIPLASYFAVHTKELYLLYHIVCVLISVAILLYYHDHSTIYLILYCALLLLLTVSLMSMPI